MTVATLTRIAAPLSARVACRLTWNGEALDRLLDSAHAAAVDSVGTLRACGWEVASEASFNIWGERGSVDVLAFHPPTAIVLAVEVKSVVPDVQAMLTALDRKARLGLSIARERGWSGRMVGRLLVILDTRTARRRIETHETTFATAFPHRSTRVRRWLRSPDPAEPFAGLWFLTNDTQAVEKQRVGCPGAPKREPPRNV